MMRKDTIRKIKGLLSGRIDPGEFDDPKKQLGRMSGEELNFMVNLKRRCIAEGRGADRGGYRYNSNEISVLKRLSDKIKGRPDNYRELNQSEDDSKAVEYYRELGLKRYGSEV